MKRFWISNLVTFGVIALLTLFLGLQYNWLTQASDAERERMKRRVEADTASFADEFNREIQAAYFNFQADADRFRNADYAEFNERYDFWKNNTAFSELIREINYLPNEQDPNPLRYSPGNRTFEPVLRDDALEEIVGHAKTGAPPAVTGSGFVLVVPIHPAGRHVERILLKRNTQPQTPEIKIPEPIGYVVVRLDNEVVKQRMLPELAARHFPETDFDVSIVDQGGQSVFARDAVGQTPDASAPLFDLTPDKLIFFSNRDVMVPRTRVEKNSGMVFNHRVESQTIGESNGRSESKGETLTIELQENNGKPRTAVIASSKSVGDSWTLNVQHNAGSIDAFVQGERNKSFLIGLGVYLLLVGSIVAIVLSAMRSKRFAQRQIDFVSSVSHEFRTPLAVIYSAGENLADGVAKNESQIVQYGDLIRGEGKKLSGMVEQILEFAGARSGRKKYNFAATDISKVTREALVDCQSILKEKGILVESDIRSDLPLVNADAEALSGAIRNLIQNSIKYSNGSRWIRIGAENRGGAIKISVEDRGVGISETDQRHVFEPFFRAKDVVDSQIRGNGLGLSLVKEITEAHGGCVSVTSEEGKGSKFMIELPVDRNKSQRPPSD